MRKNCGVQNFLKNYSNHLKKIKKYIFMYKVLIVNILKSIKW